MARQVALCRVTPEAMAAALGELEIDPGFEGFVAFCQQQGIGMTIVSDGLDVVIRSVLRRYGLALPHYANRLESVGGQHWRLGFPHARPDCVAHAGHCKCARMTNEDAGRTLKVVVGDGRSDFCIAGRADLVIAKASLLKRCREQGLPHRPFADFFEVTEQLAAWLEGRSTGNGSRHRTKASDVCEDHVLKAF